MCFKNATKLLFFHLADLWSLFLCLGRAARWLSGGFYLSRNGRLRYSGRATRRMHPQSWQRAAGIAPHLGKAQCFHAEVYPTEILPGWHFEKWRIMCCKSAVILCIIAPRVAFVVLQNRLFKGNIAALLGNGLNRPLCNEKEAKYQCIIMWTAALQK